MKNLKENFKFVIGILVFLLLLGFVGHYDRETELLNCNADNYYTGCK